MEQQTEKMPVEAILLYNDYIHGEISRREFIDGAKRLALTGVALAAITEGLMPNYALGQQVRKDDERIKASYETVQSPMGNGSIKGYFVKPSSADTREAMPLKLPAVLVVHENRGLNPHIEDVARRFALEGFMAFAPDGLTSVGGFPGNDYQGGQLFMKVDGNKMREDFVAAGNWLRSRPDCTGKLCATGFCFGGGVSNILAIRLGENIAAVAPFYGGNPPLTDVPKIKAAVLAHHGELDTRLAMAWPMYKAELDKNKIPNEGHIYKNAVHGFHCDATPERYNKAAATEAWNRTIEWFNQYARASS
jgi:carboxymethylenebutenolidase